MHLVFLVAIMMLISRLLASAKRPYTINPDRGFNPVYPKNVPEPPTINIYPARVKRKSYKIPNARVWLAWSLIFGFGMVIFVKVKMDVNRGRVLAMKEREAARKEYEGFDQIDAAQKLLR